MKLADLSMNRFVFFAFNLLLLLIGVAYIGIGSWLVDSLKVKSGIDLVNENYTSMAGIMITVGCLCVINSFIGFMLLIVAEKLFAFIFYLIAIIFIFLFGISVGIVGLGFAATANAKLSDQINKNLFLQSDSLALVNSIQQTYKCCGLDNSTDWTDWINKQSLPASCCIYNNNSCKTSEYFQVGCLKAVNSAIIVDMSICGAISLAIALPLIMGMIIISALILELIETQSTIKYQIAK